MIGPLPVCLILTEEQMRPVTARNEKRKSVWGDQVNYSKVVVGQFATQVHLKCKNGMEACKKWKRNLGSAWNAKLERLDKRPGKVSAKCKKGKKVVGKNVNNSINWFFAVGTMEDDTGRIYRVTPVAASARKESIKTVRFERLTARDQNNLKITKLMRVKNRRARARRQKGIATANARNKAREEKRRRQENAYYAVLQADHQAQQCIEQCVMSGALDSEEVLDEMQANDAILRSFEQSGYNDTDDDGTGNDDTGNTESDHDLSGYLSSIKEEPEKEDAELGNLDPNRIVNWEVIVPRSTSASIAARTVDPSIQTFSAIIQERIYVFMLWEHVAKQGRAEADNDAETDTYEGAKARGRAGSWLHLPKQREIIKAFHENEEAKYLAAKAALAESIFEEAGDEEIVDNAAIEPTAVDHIAVEEATFEQTAVAHAAVKEAALEDFALHRASIAKEAAPGEFAFDWAALTEVEVVTQGSSIEDTAIELAAIEEVAVQESAIQEATLEESAVQQATVKETSVEEAAIENAVIENAVTQNVVTKDAATDKTSVEEAALEDAATEVAATEDTATEDTAIEDTAIEDLAAIQASVVRVFALSTLLKIDEAIKNAALEDPDFEFWHALRLSLERTQLYYLTTVEGLAGGEVLVRLPKRPDAELRLGVYVPVNKRDRSRSLGAPRT